ncbi:BQ5605_C007g04492 [Microbotryum silenes-dioicae]|uniref:BQ5605_C007g04492 protein n=1 Tax=Microbotryum silenes-dioicae TaxID=796604 RepID=A0A2X0P9J8_9BASI|nr:BQ5605_C007g04492 [Microbotryum silenes-dioicae]
MSIQPRPPIPPITPTPFTQLVESFLNQSLAVLVASDARLLVGYFICLDQQGNLVLDNTYEYPAEKDEQEEEGVLPLNRLASQEGRSVGMVLVPRKEWKGVWLHTGEQTADAEKEQANTTFSNEAYI